MKLKYRQVGYEELEPGECTIETMAPKLWILHYCLDNGGIIGISVEPEGTKSDALEAVPLLRTSEAQWKTNELLPCEPDSTKRRETLTIAGLPETAFT